MGVCSRIAFSRYVRAGRELELGPGPGPHRGAGAAPWGRGRTVRPGPSAAPPAPRAICRLRPAAIFLHGGGRLSCGTGWAGRASASCRSAAGRCRGPCRSRGDDSGPGPKSGGDCASCSGSSALPASRGCPREARGGGCEGREKGGKRAAACGAGRQRAAPRFPADPRERGCRHAAGEPAVVVPGQLRRCDPAGQRLFASGHFWAWQGGTSCGNATPQHTVCPDPCGLAAPQGVLMASPQSVMCTGYRLAPEHKYPAAYEDCLSATIHFMKNIEHYDVDPGNVIVCGDSAGGNLAAAVSQTLAGRSDLPKLRAQILIYPGLQALDFNLPSYQQNRGVPLLFRERAAFYVLQYLNGNASNLDEVLEGSHIPIDIKLNYRKWVSPDNIPEKFKVRGYKPHVLLDCTTEIYETVKRFCEPNLCPLLAEDAIIHQLPESFILTCEYDVLRDDGLLYKKRLEDNGVRVTWYHLEDGFHGIISLYDYCGFLFTAGKRGLDRTVKFLKRPIKPTFLMLLTLMSPFRLPNLR
ncbi:arylacetamide deacetylase-like 3 [Falco rusticolus]|uniref:arylacetamide deacetylase-like 3 n=1 Tax=Falco rusticolus TaxID=120794 RepID=UPI001886538D|nr:arylacetamide deacetylase-like 3 [Falco rusticolus]